MWIKLKEVGYKRTVQGLYRVMQRIRIYKKTPSKKKRAQPVEWETGKYPGEKIQNLKKTLKELEINYKVIKPHTSKQIGRVEKSHRKD